MTALSEALNHLRHFRRYGFGARNDWYGPRQHHPIEEVRSVHRRRQEAIDRVRRFTTAQTEVLGPIFDSGGSQFNRKAAVAVGIVDPANDRRFVQFNYYD